MVHENIEQKLCLGCKNLKAANEFGWHVKARGLRKPRCRPCDKLYRARYYRASLVKTRARQERARISRLARVRNGEVSEPKQRECVGCHRRLSVQSFRWRDKAALVRINRCRLCDRAHRAGLYEANREEFLRRNKVQHEKLRQLLEVHKQHPCVDCGKTYPQYVMDFDHLPGSTKVAKVSSLVYFGSEKLLLDEIAKCELVCANCHRERTFGSTRR